MVGVIMAYFPTRLVPIGTILAWGGADASPPTGYLICDGSAISRTTYARLFAVIGTFFGAGDGSTEISFRQRQGRNERAHCGKGVRGSDLLRTHDGRS